MKITDYETYIFDLDGTLLDTLNDLATCTNYALYTYGIPQISIEDVRAFVGNGVKKLIERAIPDGEHNPLFDKVLNTFREYYLEHCHDTTRPYNGVEETLYKLKMKGKNMAIASNKFQTATSALVHHFFPDTISVAVGEREGIRRKPAPDMITEVLKLLGKDRKEAVYIGDSDTDIITARNSGIPCISVLWGFRDKKFLIEHNAETLVFSPKDLLG